MNASMFKLHRHSGKGKLKDGAPQVSGGRSPVDGLAEPMPGLAPAGEILSCFVTREYTKKHAPLPRPAAALAPGHQAGWPRKLASQTASPDIPALVAIRSAGREDRNTYRVAANNGIGYAPAMIALPFASEDLSDVTCSSDLGKGFVTIELGTKRRLLDSPITCLLFDLVPTSIDRRNNDRRGPHAVRPELVEERTAPLTRRLVVRQAHHERNCAYQSFTWSSIVRP